MSENPYSSPAGSAVEPTFDRRRSPLVPVAITLLVVSILWFFFALFGILFFCFVAIQPDSDPELQSMQLLYAAYLGIEAIYSCLLVTGALSMIRRGSYAWAVVTSCLALFPILSPFYVLGIPIGIWALFVLRKPHVKAAFTKL